MTTAEYRYVEMSKADVVLRIHVDPDGQLLEDYAAKDGLFRSGLRVRALTQAEVDAMLQNFDNVQGKMKDRFGALDRALNK